MKPAAMDFSGEALSPLLRLYSDIWSALGRFLAPGDFTRLLNCGNQRLMDLLKTSARDCKLQWTSSLYIDLNRVFLGASPFKRVLNLEFSSSMAVLRSLPSVDSNLLPRTLTSLSLSFRDAPSFMLRGNLGLSCPELLYLRLDDISSLVHGRASTPKLKLVGLPAPLLLLRIQSKRLYLIPLEDYEALPPRLETLELLFPPDIPHLELNASFALPIPSLRPPLKSLSLVGTQQGNWSITLANLPETLESFQLDAPQISLNTAALASLSTSILNLENCKHKLLNLKSFIAPELLIELNLVLELFPPSLTDLQATIRCRGTLEDLTTANWLGARLSHYEASHSVPLLKYFSSGAASLPRLRSLSSPRDHLLFLGNLSPQAPMLRSINARVAGNIPLAINSFILSEPPRPSIIPYSPQHALTALELHNVMDLDAEWISALPNTLESFAAPIKGSAWRELFESMIESPSRLPKLEVIMSNSTLSFKSLGPFLEGYELCDVSSAENGDTPAAQSNPIGFPAQVKELYMTIDKALSAASASDLKSFQDSNVERLNITLVNASSTSCISSVQTLLNGLPHKLKTLSIDLNCQPSPYWPVKLPQTLQKVTWIARLSDREEYKATGTAETFRFPASVTELHAPNEALPIACLPPCLSQYTVGANAFDSTLETVAIVNERDKWTQFFGVQNTP